MKKDFGYTLMELLVVIAIMGILMVISSSIFIGILKSNSKTLVLSQVRDEGNHALDLFSRSISNAVTLVEPDGLTQGQGDNTCQKEIIVRNKSNDINYMNVVGSNPYTRFRFVPETPTTNGYVAMDGASATTAFPTMTPAPITNNNGTNAVSLQTANPANSGDQTNFDITNANNPCFIVSRSNDRKTVVVRVQFTLKQSVTASTSRQEQIGNVNFQSAYTIRSY